MSVGNNRIFFSGCSGVLQNQEFSQDFLDVPLTSLTGKEGHKIGMEREDRKDIRDGVEGKTRERGSKRESETLPETRETREARTGNTTV